MLHARGCSFAAFRGETEMASRLVGSRSGTEGKGERGGWSMVERPTIGTPFSKTKPDLTLIYRRALPPRCPPSLLAQSAAGVNFPRRELIHYRRARREGTNKQRGNTAAGDGGARRADCSLPESLFSLPSARIRQQLRSVESRVNTLARR